VGHRDAAVETFVRRDALASSALVEVEFEHISGKKNLLASQMKDGMAREMASGMN